LIYILKLAKDKNLDNAKEVLKGYKELYYLKFIDLETVYIGIKKLE